LFVGDAKINMTLAVDQTIFPLTDLKVLVHFHLEANVFLTSEEREKYRRECLSELEANTVDLKISDRRIPNHGEEINLSELFRPKLDADFYDQYKEKLDCLESV